MSNESYLVWRGEVHNSSTFRVVSRIHAGIRGLIVEELGKDSLDGERWTQVTDVYNVVILQALLNISEKAHEYMEAAAGREEDLKRQIVDSNKSFEEGYEEAKQLYGNQTGYLKLQQRFIEASDRASALDAKVALLEKNNADLTSVLRWGWGI